MLAQLMAALNAGGAQMGSPGGGGGSPAGLPFPRPGMVPMAGGAPNNAAMLHALGAPGFGGTLAGGPPSMPGIGMGRMPIRPSTGNMSPVSQIVRDHFAKRAGTQTGRGGLGTRTTLGM